MTIYNWKSTIVNWIYVACAVCCFTVYFLLRLNLMPRREAFIYNLACRQFSTACNYVSLSCYPVTFFILKWNRLGRLKLAMTQLITDQTSDGVRESGARLKLYFFSVFPNICIDFNGAFVLPLVVCRKTRLFIYQKEYWIIHEIYH